MSALGELLEDLGRVLGAHGLRWYLFGAQAVVVRGRPRATQDVDVTVEVARDGLVALRASLAAAGFTERVPDLADELLCDGRVLLLRHRAGLDLDLVLAGPGLEQHFLDGASLVVVDGVEVPVASATHLVVMKILSGRPRDVEDVRSVLAAGQVDLDEARLLLGALESALGVSDLVRALDDLAT